MIYIYSNLATNEYTQIKADNILAADAIAEVKIGKNFKQCITSIGPFLSFYLLPTLRNESYYDKNNNLVEVFVPAFDAILDTNGDHVKVIGNYVKWSDIK